MTASLCWALMWAVAASPARVLDHDEANLGASTARPDVLWVEQARLALGRGRPDLSRRYAVRALNAAPESWDAWRLYLRASSRAGLREAAEAELAALNDPGASVALAWWRVANGAAEVDTLQQIQDPRGQVAWGYSVLARGREQEVLALILPDDPLAARLRLRALALAGDAKGLHHAALSWLHHHPEHPDVLEELWRKGAPETRTRKKVLRALRARLETEQDPAWLLLASRTLVQARERGLAEAVAARVDAEGLLAPLPRMPWGTSMRKAMGKALVGQGPGDLPPGSEAERVAVAWEVAEAWLVRGRADDALALWDALESDRWLAWRGRARALEVLGRRGEAMGARGRAIRGALGPWAEDPCGLARGARLTAVAAVVSDGPVPEGLDAQARQALAGDAASWRDILASHSESPALDELSACLDAAAGGDLGEGWVGPRGDAAKAVIPDLAAAGIARLPDDVQRLGAARSGVLGRGERLPHLTLRLDDGDHDLHELAAEPGPLILSLWASWCGPCQTELPLVDQLVGELVSAGVAIQPLAISVDEDPRPYRRQLQRKPFAHLRSGRDPSLLFALGGSSLPVTWVVDDEAVVRLVHVGYDPELPARLEAVLRSMEE